MLAQRPRMQVRPQRLTLEPHWQQLPMQAQPLPTLAQAPAGQAPEHPPLQAEEHHQQLPPQGF